MDHGEGRVRAKALTARVAGAKRGGSVDYHADAVLALEPGIAIEIDRIAEGCIRQQHRDPVAIFAQQPLLCLGAGTPVVRIDVANERRQAGPERRLCRRGKGEGGHQGVTTRRLIPGGFAQCDHQTERGVADRKARAPAAEQGLGRLRFEGAHFRTIIAEHARGLDTAERLDMGAELGRVGGNQGIAHAGGPEWCATRGL
ncbi:hypothetical protein D9M73_111360 [compost metagenome]